MLLRDFAIGVIFFSLVITASAFLMGGFENRYSTDIDQNLYWEPANESFNETFSSMSEMQATAEQMANQTQTQGLEGQGVAEALAGGTWNVIMLIWDSFGIIKDLVANIAEQLGMPSWFVIGLLAIITISIVFAIISLFTRREA